MAWILFFKWQSASKKVHVQVARQFDTLLNIIKNADSLNSVLDINFSEF